MNGSRREDLFSSFLIFLLCLLYIYPIFEPGFLIVADNPFHIAISHLLVETLIPKYSSLTGWGFYDFTGFPALLYSPVLGIYLVAFLSLASGAIVETSYKIIMFAAYLFPAVSLYSILRRRYGYLPSLFCSLLFVSQWEGVTYFILRGMWGQYLSIGILLIFLDIFSRSLERELTFKSASVLGILIALTTLAHYFSMIVALYSIVIIFILRARAPRGNPIKTFALTSWMLVSGFMISAFYTLPIIETVNWINPLGWGVGNTAPSIVYNIIRALIFPVSERSFVTTFLINLPVIIVALLALAGILLFLSERRKRPLPFLTFVFTFCIISLILSSGFWFLHPTLKKLPIFTGITSERFIVYVRIGLLIFSAYAISQFFQKKYCLPFSHHFPHSKRLFKKLTIFLLISLFAVNLFIYQSTPMYRNSMKTSKNVPIMRNVQNVWEWIKNNVNGTITRVTYQSFEGNLKNWSYREAYFEVLGMSTYLTGVQSLGTVGGSHPYPLEEYTATYQRKIFGKSINNISDMEIADFMMTFNSKYIVSCEPRLWSILKSSDLFYENVTYGPLSIFSLKNYTPSWVTFNYQIAANLVKLEEQEIIYQVNNEKTDMEMTLKVAFHPYWHAYINDKEVEVERDIFHLIRIRIHETGYLTIRFVYKPIKMIYPIISLLGFLITTLSVSDKIRLHFWSLVKKLCARIT